MINLLSEGFRKGDIVVLYGKGDCIFSDFFIKLDFFIKIVEENSFNYFVVSILCKYSGLERLVIVMVDLE